MRQPRWRLVALVAANLVPLLVLVILKTGLDLAIYTLRGRKRESAQAEGT